LKSHEAERQRHDPEERAARDNHRTIGGTKNATIRNAKAKTIAPIPVKLPNATSALKRAMAAARSICPAPMFCPTRVDVAIERPMAGMMTKLRTLKPMPYAATVTVPKLAMRKVMTVSPSARADCSIEAGNPSMNACLKNARSGRKSARLT